MEKSNNKQYDSETNTLANRTIDMAVVLAHDTLSDALLLTRLSVPTRNKYIRVVAVPRTFEGRTQRCEF